MLSPSLPGASEPKFLIGSSRFRSAQGGSAPRKLFGGVAVGGEELVAPPADDGGLNNKVRWVALDGVGGIALGGAGVSGGGVGGDDELLTGGGDELLDEGSEPEGSGAGAELGGGL